MKQPEDWPWWSYNNLALAEAAIGAGPIYIDGIGLPLGYRTGEKSTVSTGRRAVTVVRQDAE